ncbi:hypothetical protein TNCV_1681221 [Trichonephila clavipes]|nr:hypothetical protein TNCV_1681221 [Trichonephila clavipes]
MNQARKEPDEIMHIHHDNEIQLPRAMHRFKRRRRRVDIKDSTRNGIRNPKCLSNRRLHMVREDTEATNEGSTLCIDSS